MRRLWLMQGGDVHDKSAPTAYSLVSIIFSYTSSSLPGQAIHEKLEIGASINPYAQEYEWISAILVCSRHAGVGRRSHVAI